MKRMGKLERVSSAADLRQMLGGSGPFQFWLFQQRWKDIAGHVLAEESRVGRRDGTLLYIHVTNSVWMQELVMHKRELLRRVQEDAYGRQFTDMRFVIAAPAAAEAPRNEADRLRDRLRAGQDVKAQPVTEAEEQWIHWWAGENVKKETLRPVIEAMMRRALSFRKGQLAAGYHPCARCGELCAGDDTLCARCRLEAERHTRYRLMLLLQKEPALRFADAALRVPCRYREYAEARDALIHRYRENYANRRGTEEERRRLLSLLTHKPFEDITEEEAAKALPNLPKRKYPRYGAVEGRTKESWGPSKKNF